jgi:uncharacterized protein YjiS (DUF1127 family)
MTVQTYSHHHEDHVPGFLARIWERLTHIGEAFVEAREMQARYQVLSLMSDRQLADIGLTRDGIPHAVLHRHPLTLEG